MAQPGNYPATPKLFEVAAGGAVRTRSLPAGVVLPIPYVHHQPAGHFLLRTVVAGGAGRSGAGMGGEATGVAAGSRRGVSRRGRISDGFPRPPLVSGPNHFGRTPLPCRRFTPAGAGTGGLSGLTGT